MRIKASMGGQKRPQPGNGNGDKSEIATRGGTARLLIADKFPLVRAGVRYEVQKSGIASVVGEANDGKEAVELARKLTPDIVMMGIGLRVLNGLEATARITRAQPGCRVIILSRHDNEEYVWGALRKGATGYLLKRAAVEELNEAIARVQQGETYISRDLAKHLFQKFCSGSFPSTHSALNKLTERQCQILQLIAEGHNTKEIGEILGLSSKTVDFHRGKLMGRLGLRNVPELVRFAFREKLIEGE